MAQTKTIDVLTWSIHVFDRTTKKLPLDVKFYVLDWSLVSTQDEQLIKQLLAARRAQNKVTLEPAGLDDHVVTTSLTTTASSLDHHFFRFRKYFVERPTDFIENLFVKNAECNIRTDFVFVHEYYEDQNALPISRHEMMDIIAGCETLILNDPESVLRIGPVELAQNSDWSVKDSNNLAQFLQVVQHIRESRWATTDISLSLGGGKAGSAGLEAFFPDSEDVSAVAAWFRQLVSKDRNDDIFNTATKAYLKAVNNDGKRTWVRVIKKRFNDLLQARSDFTQIGEVNIYQLLELLFYDGRLLHSRPQNNATIGLAELSARHGREQVVFAIHSALRTVFRDAVLVSYPLLQDFSFWRAKGIIPAPTIVDVSDFMRGGRV